MKKLSILMLCIHLYIFGINGCAKAPLQKAFDGTLPPHKSNKLISQYCQSCHNHKDFQPDEHVIALSENYKKNLYARAKECRVCHHLQVDIWKYEKHLTRYPGDVKKGKYKEFEKSFLTLSEKPKNQK
ncbi:MAG: hypothetical protein ACE5FU_10335 [Nitrospinota bacterium]